VYWSVLDDRRVLLLSILYRLLRCLLGLTAVLVRRDLRAVDIRRSVPEGQGKR